MGKKHAGVGRGQHGRRVWPLLPLSPFPLSLFLSVLVFHFFIPLNCFGFLWNRAASCLLVTLSVVPLTFPTNPHNVGFISLPSFLSPTSTSSDFSPLPHSLPPHLFPPYSSHLSSFSPFLLSHFHILSSLSSYLYFSTFSCEERQWKIYSLIVFC